MACKTILSAFALGGLLTGTALAVTIATVPVGNPGNAGEWSGESHGGYGPNRICGAVNYEYRIGKYEVTAGQYTEFLNKVAATDMYGLYNTQMWSSITGCKIQRSGSSGTYTYSVASDHANRPVNYVSYWDACRFTNWLHNDQPTGPQGEGTTETGAYTLNGYNGQDGRTIQRNPDWKWAITSEDEWYKAAYYNPAASSYYDYPTSSNTSPGQDMADASGNNANYYTAPYTYPLDSPHYTTVAGEFQNSNSPYGTFDQGGNVWEWNEALVSGSYRGLRGGSFYDGDDDDLHASYRNAEYDGPAAEFGDVGFRVVPEPATLSLIVLGGLAMLRRKAAA